MHVPVGQNSNSNQVGFTTLHQNIAAIIISHSRVIHGIILTDATFHKVDVAPNVLIFKQARMSFWITVKNGV